MGDGMFDTTCGYCGKPMKTYAKDKMGTLPVVYCSRPCEQNAKEKKRYVTLRR
jgi:hypothetical protein